MKTESPLKGWPKTTKLEDGSGYRIRARYLSPERIRLIELVCMFLILSFVSGCVYWAVDADPKVRNEQEGSAMGLVMILSAFTFATHRLWGRLFFGNVTTIEFRPNQIRIKNGLRGFRNYDRNFPHEFDYTIHDKAEDEYEREDKARREGKRKGSMFQKLFRRSFHVVLRYAGQRVDVASIYGKKHAEALLVRLQLVDELMDAMTKRAAGAPQFAEPDKQYGQRPAAG